MLGYYLKLALKSLARTPLVAAISIIAIALGIAVPTTMISVYHVFAQDPAPEKSDRLFNVRVDSWDPDQEFFDVRPGDPPKHITYRDMTGLMASDLPQHQTGIATARIYAFPESESLQPYMADVRLCHSGFFPLTGAPFASGSAWGAEVDREPEQVVVLSHRTNEKLFGGKDSVGRQVRLGEHDYAVIGVLGPWHPTPQYYDVINNAMGDPLDFFVPFDLIRNESLALLRSGDSDSWGTPTPRDDPDAFFTASETTWIQFWVELAPAEVAAYTSFVDNYTQAAKELGRFPRPLNNRVTPLMEWMEYREVVPAVTRPLIVISILFLLVCALNLTGLLLGKFLSTAGVIGVHRALGASRWSIFAQRLIECELLGVIGGVLGIGLAGLGLGLISGALPAFIARPGLFALDTSMLALAVSLSLAAGLVAGLYPAWRACRVAPAIQLKLQ